MIRWIFHFPPNFVLELHALSVPWYHHGSFTFYWYIHTHTHFAFATYELSKSLLRFFVVVVLFFKIYLNWRLTTLQYCGGFCHTFTWISHGSSCVPHSQTPSHLPPHSIPRGHPSAWALSTLYHASNLAWWSISNMIIYMFQCYSLKSSHPHLLPQSPKVCSLHPCLFCYLAYRVIITIFLNSVYML